MQEKVLPISVNFLYPGIILKGDAYTETGEKVHEGFIPFTDEKIAWLKSRGIKTIYYSQPEGRNRISGGTPLVSQETLDRGMDVAREVEKCLKENAPLPAREVSAFINELVEKVVPLKGTTLNLVELKNYDDYTYTHSLNVALLSLVLGKKLGYNEEQLQILGVGSMLHDIGKLKIPLEILNKPDRLTAQEFEVMKKHPLYGFEIVRNVFSRFVQAIVLYHHEKVSGMGYPMGKKGEEMGEFAQIAGLSDVFDAITSARPYKPAQPVWYALLSIYREEGKSFSSRLAQTFLSEIPQYFGDNPVFLKGNFVQLNTGEIVYVPENSFTLWPQVIILINERREIPLRKVVIDLSRDDKRMIEKVIYEEKLTQALEKITHRYVPSDSFDGKLK